MVDLSSSLCGYVDEQIWVVLVSIVSIGCGPPVIYDVGGLDPQLENHGFVNQSRTIF